MSPTLEDQERHLLVKVIDRILYKLDDLVRPYVHKILVVIEPLLIDEDYYARVEGREIISNLAKVISLRFIINSFTANWEFSVTNFKTLLSNFGFRCSNGWNQCVCVRAVPTSRFADTVYSRLLKYPKPIISKFV